MCDTFVIVAGVCLTASLKWGSAALFLRNVRIAALGHRWFAAAQAREAPVRRRPTICTTTWKLNSAFVCDVSDGVAAG